MTEDQIQSILKFRRMRSEIFGEGLFSDPAWDILLALFAAGLGKRRMTLRELAPLAPETTLARWVAALEEKKLIVIEPDPSGTHRSWVALSHECAAKMSIFLSGAPHFAQLQ